MAAGSTHCAWYPGNIESRHTSDTCLRGGGRGARPSLGVYEPRGLKGPRPIIGRETNQWSRVEGPWSLLQGSARSEWAPSRHDNPRPAGGGRLNAPPPLRFFEESENTTASAAGFSPTLPPPHVFRNFCENFDPWSRKVRSPGQVKWPNYKITFQSRYGYKVSGKVMKPSKYDEVIIAYKTYISDFLYPWPQVRSFLRPPHYKSMGKKSTPLYLLWRQLIWVESYLIGELWTIRVNICIAYPSKGHLRSPEVTNRHLPITFDQKEVGTWDWCQYVRLGHASRLICNMNHFGHHVTLAWLDLRSNFDLDLSRSFYIWFDAP